MTAPGTLGRWAGPTVVLAAAALVTAELVFARWCDAQIAIHAPSTIADAEAICRRWGGVLAFGVYPGAALLLVLPLLARTTWGTRPVAKVMIRAGLTVLVLGAFLALGLVTLLVTLDVRLG